MYKWFCNLFTCKGNDDDNENNNNDKENKKQQKKINSEFYDSILKIDRIKDINDGWEIKIRNNYKFNNDIVKIGIIGEAKKGKTYILQKLINKNIEKDEIINTEGLSSKYPNENDINNNRNYIILDITGIEKPLLNKDKKNQNFCKIELNEIEDLEKEKLLTELFLQQFIIKYCEIPLMVVGDLTFSEQKLLTKIKNILSNKKDIKKMFIIHNLQNYYNIQDVKKYVKNILLNLIGIKLKERKTINTEINEEIEKLNNIYYEQEFEDKNIDNSIIHLITANEFSEAGKYYNSFAIDFLLQNLNQFTYLSFFSLKDAIIESFIEFSKIIFKEPAIKNQFMVNESLDSIIIKFNGQINYKNHLEYQLQTYNLYNNNIVPEFSYYTHNDQFIVEIEVAGKTSDIECTFNLENGYYYFNFSGKKINSKKDNLEIHDFYTSKNNNLFKLKFAISADKIILKSNDYDFEDLGNGILSFKFELYKKTKNKKIYE